MIRGTNQLTGFNVLPFKRHVERVDLRDFEARRTYEEVFDKLMQENKTFHAPVSEVGDPKVQPLEVNKVVARRGVTLRLVVNNANVEVKWVNGQLTMRRVV